MAKTILIPTDGSDYSQIALDYGIYISKYFDVTLLGLHVIDIKIVQGPLFSDIAFYGGMPAYYEFLPKIEEALNKRGDSILQSFQEHCHKAGIPCETKKVLGLVDETIVEEGEKTDWILLAQKGEHYHLGAGGLLGSTTGCVVRKSKKPLWVTPSQFKEIESMGIAYDGSAPADAALKLAVELSAEAHWPLTAITVTDDHKLAAELVDRIEDFLAPLEIDGTSVVLQGKADRAILDFINEGAVELMVMGSQSHGRLRDFFLGSTTAHVARNSSIPILIAH
jgi:nucleotide-binding universal stress UspA family protein